MFFITSELSFSASDERKAVSGKSRWLLRAIKIIGLLFAVPLVLALFYAGTAFALVLFPANADRPLLAPAVEAYVITYGAHTDLVFPVTSPAMDWTKYFPASDFE